VRYWAALGLLMRGAETVQREQGLLRRALGDASPYVQIVAAEALGKFGSAADLEASLSVLRELVATSSRGVFVTMSALSTIEALGPKAQSLHDLVRSIKGDAGSPDARFNSYVPRLIENIVPPR